MNSPATALMWEIWRRGRPLVWVILGTILCCALIGQIAGHKPYVWEHYQSIFWLLMVATLFLTFGIFHHAEYNRGKSWHGFPYRLFSLPVSTLQLVAIPMLLGVASVEFVYWAWAKLVFAPWGRSISFWPAACVGVGLMCHQAIVWGFAGYRITRIIALSFTGLFFVNLGMVPLLEDIKMWEYEKVVRVARWLLAGISLAAFFGAWISLERQRRGGGRGKGSLKIFWARLLDYLPRRSSDFASPASAQFWFEWRRSGLMLPVATGLILLLVLAPVSWLMRSDSDAVLLTLGWTLALPLILCAVVGKAFSKPDFWSGDLNLPAFLAVRPIGSSDFVVAKMKIAALSVALAWLQILIFLACYLPLWAKKSALKEIWNACTQLYSRTDLYWIFGLIVATAMILSWRMLVESMWVGLSGSTRAFFGSAAAHVLSVILLICAAVWFQRFFWTHLDQIIHNLRWIGWVAVALVIVKLSIALFSWRSVISERAWKYMAFWWAGSLCLAALAWLLNPPFPHLKQVLIIIAFLPVPLARIGFAHTSLAANRHR